MKFIGRSSALTEIVSLSDAPDNKAIVVYGERGVGRTGLLEEAQRSASVHTLLARVNPAEKALPLSGLSVILTSLGDGRLAEFAGRFTLSSATDETLFAAAGSLLSLLRGIALEPTILLIDDVDQMDRESQVILGFMSSRLTATGLSLVFSLRSPLPGSPFSGLPTIALRPLPSADTRALVEAWASGNPVDAGTREIISEGAKGLPVAVREIVEGLAAAHLCGREPIVMPFRSGPRMRAIADDLLAPLSPAQLVIVTTLSTAAASELGIVSSESAETADTLEDLVTAGIVSTSGRYVYLTDPVVRSTVYWGLSARDRRQLHSQLAAQYAEHEPRLAGWHDSWAQPVGSRTVDLLWAAAAWAADGHRDVAVEFAERWLAVQQGEPSTDDAMVAFVEALMRNGDIGLAKRYARFGLSRSASTGAAVELARLNVLSRFLLDEAEPDESTVSAVTTAAVADDTTVPTKRSQFLLTMAALHAERGDLQQAERSLASAQFPAATIPTARDSSESPDAQRWYWCSALTVAQRSHGPNLHRSTILREPDALAAPAAIQVFAARALTFSERYSDARRLFRAASAKADPNDRTLTDVTEILAVENEILSGHFDEADALMHQLDSTGDVFAFRRLLLGAWRLQIHGQPAMAEALVADAQAMADRRRDPVLSARLHKLMGTAALMSGDPESAVDHLRRADEMCATLSFVRHSRHTADYIEALSATGAATEARQVLAQFDARRRHSPTRWSALVATRCAALLAPDEVAAARFEDALALFSSNDSPYELARTLRSFAIRLDELAGPEAGDAQRSAANRLFVGIGALGWVPATTRVSIFETGETAAPSTPSGTSQMLSQLTDNELAIVRLVQSGYRNKEIAAQLFLSLRTVEVRLTQIYRKTGARSRSYLLAMLTRETAGGPPVAAGRRGSGSSGAKLSGTA